MKKEKALVLIVDDNRYLCELVRDVLEADGYRVLVAYNGRVGWQLAREELPDLVILDVEMPEMDGFAVCKKLRSDKQTDSTPILFLTIRSALSDKSRAFKLGADDYLIKPFEPLELKLRVEARLRQARHPLRPERRGLVLDQEERLCWVPGQPAPIPLTDRETAILAYMLSHPYQAVSAKTLMDRALGEPLDASQTTSAVRNMMVRLREKIEPDPQKPRFIRTLRQAGYMLSPVGGKPAPKVATTG